ncbi:MAG: hypothetical protein M1813_008045 [Trichoglossum hirsutum]|nr:MAG: hypothetical protein M1813_008045 [Trichoglossum hirsutum]
MSLVTVKVLSAAASQDFTASIDVTLKVIVLYVISSDMLVCETGYPHIGKEGITGIGDCQRRFVGSMDTCGLATVMDLSDVVHEYLIVAGLSRGPLAGIPRLKLGLVRVDSDLAPRHKVVDTQMERMTSAKDLQEIVIFGWDERALRSTITIAVVRRDNGSAKTRGLRAASLYYAT